VVDKLIEEYDIEEYDNGKYTYYKFTDVLGEVDEIIKTVQDKINKPFFDNIQLSSNSRINHWFQYFTSFEFRSFIYPLPEIFSLVKGNRIDDAKQFTTDLLKGAFMTKFMEMTRRSWIPQCGEGSQNTELAGHKILAKTILEIAEKEEREIEQEDDT
jgi:hypothetical protein